MSLINDALKQARQAPPRNPPNSTPPLQPAAAPDDPSPTAVWLVPAIIIVLVFGAIFFIGWAVAHKAVHESILTAPNDEEDTNQVEIISVPVGVLPTSAPPVIVTNLAPKFNLQGIFFSPTAPSAIMAGKTIHPGDQFRQYTVKEITRNTVILLDTNNAEIKVGIGE